MTDLDDNGILRCAPDDMVLVNTRVAKQIDPETIRVHFDLADGSTTELDLPAHTVIYVGPLPSVPPLTFKRIEGFTNG